MGMTCSACSSAGAKGCRKKLVVRRQLRSILLTNSLQLEYDEQQTSAAAIIAAMKKSAMVRRSEGAASVLIELMVGLILRGGI